MSYLRRVEISRHLLEALLKLPEGFSVKRIGDLDWKSESFEVLLGCPTQPEYDVPFGAPIPLASIEHTIEPERVTCKIVDV